MNAKALVSSYTRFQGLHFAPPPRNPTVETEHGWKVRQASAEYPGARLSTLPGGASSGRGGEGTGGDGSQPAAPGLAFIFSV